MVGKCKSSRAKFGASLALACVCTQFGPRSLTAFLAPASGGLQPPGSELFAGVGELAASRGGLASPVTMHARSPFPTTPAGQRNKRRQRAGYQPFFHGRQVAVRVNPKTNKPIFYKMHIKKGDTVQVMKGKDAGKVTTVLRVYPKWNKALCLGVNFCIKHVRPMRDDEVGQRVQVEAPMHASNLMHYDTEAGVAGFLGIRFSTGTDEAGNVKVFKERYNKATGAQIYRKPAPKWVPVLERGNEDIEE